MIVIKTIKKKCISSVQFLSTVAPSFVIFILLCFSLLMLSAIYADLSEIYKGIYIEAWGTLFDILIVGIILTIFTITREKKDNVKRYLEAIDDFKKWDSKEAQYIIAGNIRRLIKLGNTGIDFSGIILKDFSFASNDIQSLKGSVFSLGLRMDKMSKNATELSNVDFSFVDCSEVVFSKSFAKRASLGLIGCDLSFTDATLINACFEGAQLSWTNTVSSETDWYADEGLDDRGQPIRIQMYSPAFSGADLDGCSFRYAKLENADFRDAYNILNADFTGTQDLETCYFDDKIKNKILNKFNKKK